MMKKAKSNFKTRNKIKKSKVPSPTLRTIKMVEGTLKSMNESCIKVAQLKKILPKQVNHNTLIEVLDYLDTSNKIVIGTKGITWIYNNSPEMKRELAKSWEWTAKNLRRFRNKTY